jgi:excisionase family DNA binding protein
MERTVQNQKEIPEGREYLSLRELSAYLGIPYKTLEGWKSSGYLPRHIAFGQRHHRWRKSEIDEWCTTFRHGEGRSPEPDGSRFDTFCNRKLRHRDDPIGDFARDWIGDDRRPRDASSARHVLGHLRSRGACPEAIEAAEEAWRIYRHEGGQA